MIAVCEGYVQCAVLPCVRQKNKLFGHMRWSCSDNERHQQIHILNPLLRSAVTHVCSEATDPIVLACHMTCRCKQIFAPILTLEVYPGTCQRPIRSSLLETYTHCTPKQPSDLYMDLAGDDFEDVVISRGVEKDAKNHVDPSMDLKTHYRR